MKKQGWFLWGFVAVVLATTAAAAQANQAVTIANIPFAFTVANRTLPAGRYIISRMGETNLRIVGQNQSTFVPTHRVEGKAPESYGKIVFHRYGDAYFLSEVWGAANPTGRRVFPSRGEEDRSRQGEEKEMAVLRVQ